MVHSCPPLFQEVGLNAGFWRRWVWSNFEMTEGTKYWNMQATAGTWWRTQEQEKQRYRGDLEMWRWFEELDMFSLRSNVGTDFQKHRFYKLSLFDMLEELIVNAKEQLWSTCLLPGHPAWPPQLWLTLRILGLEPSSYSEVTRGQKDNDSHQTVYKDSSIHYLQLIYSNMGILQNLVATSSQKSNWVQQNSWELLHSPVSCQISFLSQNTIFFFSVNTGTSPSDLWPQFWEKNKLKKILKLFYTLPWWYLTHFCVSINMHGLGTRN